MNIIAMPKPLIKHVKKPLTSFVGILAISSLSVFPAFSQQNPVNPAHPTTINPSPSGTTQNGRLIGGNDTYPQGSRIHTNGMISTPRGNRISPSVTIKNGDGSTSYYYRDGSRITVDSSKVAPTGTLIRR